MKVLERTFGKEWVIQSWLLGLQRTVWVPFIIFSYNFIQWPHCINICKLVINLNVADVTFISPKVLKGVAISTPTTLEQTVIMLL